MATGYILSQADREALMRLFRRFGLLRTNTENRPHVESDVPPAPEIYVARTPAGGIPAIVEGTSITGTGTPATDTPGGADCDIYRVTLHGDVPELEQVPGLSRRVYNVAADLVMGDHWIVITREKFGQWVVSGAGGGGSQSTVRKLVRLTDKTYTVGQFIRYDWLEATDSISPPLTYSVGAGGDPAYDINDVDFPVPYYVYIRPGAGSWWLIEHERPWEFNRKTGPAVAGYFPAERLYYDQDAKAIVSYKVTLLIDLNS